MSATIAWEDTSGRFLDRVWITVWSATSDPVGTFGRLGDSTSGDSNSEPDLEAALRFALVTTVIGWSPFLLITPCLAALPFAFAEALPDRVRALGLGAMCAGVGLLPFAFVAASLCAEIVHGAVFHLIARAAGGVGSARASMHAMLYTSAIRFWLAPALFLGFVPFIGSMIHLAVRAGFVLWTGIACYGAARGIHKLDDTRGLVVGIATPLLSTGLLVFAAFGIGFAFVALFAETLHLGDLLGPR